MSWTATPVQKFVRIRLGFSFPRMRDFAHQKVYSVSFFYRTTHMDSADYAVARCLFVCLSHAGILSKRLHILKVFSPLGSPAILVFPHQTGWQYSDGDPPNGGVECKGV